MPCLPVPTAGTVSIRLEIEMKRAAAAEGASSVFSLSSREATVSVLAFLVGGVVGWIYKFRAGKPMVLTMG